MHAVIRKAQVHAVVHDSGLEFLGIRLTVMENRI
jgi:hypothetical protein